MTNSRASPIPLAAFSSQTLRSGRLAASRRMRPRRWRCPSASSPLAACLSAESAASAAARASLAIRLDARREHWAVEGRAVAPVAVAALVLVNPQGPFARTLRGDAAADLGVRRMSALRRYCCKSLFAAWDSNSPKHRRDDRIIMWGTTPSCAKLTGDSDNGFEAALMGDRRLFRSLAKNQPPCLLELLQQNPPVAAIKRECFYLHDGSLLTDQSKLTNYDPWQGRGNLIVMQPWNGRCPFSGERVMLQLLQTICCVR
jgi:hypothetical protein